MKKTILIIIAVVVVVGLIYFATETMVSPESETITNDQSRASGDAFPGETATPVREFSLESFMRMDQGQRTAGFSVKDITVKKGDRVKITIVNTAGMHDFTLNEFGIHKDTPEGTSTLIEFTADKVGDFAYYCSKYDHRQLGQEGVLHVTE